MADVFISYHEKTEGAIAAEIASKLESAGITCWYAKRDVPSGGDFTKEVITQIENCTVFLLLLDDGAARSPHVEAEVANAFGRKRIMPYQTDKKNVKNVGWVPYYLKNVQIHPFPLPDYNTLTREIATALERSVETDTPEPQPIEPVPETVMPKPQPEGAAFLDGLMSTFILIYVILGNIGGFMLGRQTECVIFFCQLFDVDFTSPLGYFFCGVLGAFVGCYVGLSLGCIAARKQPDKYLAIWCFEGIILGMIIGFIIGSQGGFIGAILLGAIGACVSCYLFCMPLAFILIELVKHIR